MKHTPTTKNLKAPSPTGEGADPFKPDKRTRKCKIEGCKNEHYALGWCHMHYRRYTRYGHPLARSAAGVITLPDYSKRRRHDD